MKKQPPLSCAFWLALAFVAFGENPPQPERETIGRPIAELPDGMTAMGIGGGNMAALFSTHPPLDDRIAALKARSGR